MNLHLPKLNLSLQDWTFIMVCSIPAFYMLGDPAIYIWDEAVYANASFDMANGASWWLPVHGDYNTKPPLVLWMQAITLGIVPSLEWAIRLPSALAVTGILFLFQIGLKRWGFDPWTRLLVMISFVGHEGFIRHHIARTADLDAVMTFFVVAYVMVVMDAIKQNRWTNRHMFYFFLAVVAAFYAKSIGGWMMLGPLVIVWILSPLRGILFSLKFWLAAILSAGICLLYYFAREMLQPGFFNLVWHSEYQRMFRNIMPWHEHGASYYFTNFISLRTFTPWIYFLIASVLYSLFLTRNRATRQVLLQWTILGLGYMLVITIPAVKLEWYDAPAYPFFALITGTVAGILVAMLPARWKILAYLPVIFVLIRKMDFIRHDIQPRHPFEYEGAMLRRTEINERIKVFMKVESPEHRLQLDLYVKQRDRLNGIKTDVIDQLTQVYPGDRIIISQADNHKLISASFELDTIKTWPGLGYEIEVIRKRNEQE